MKKNVVSYLLPVHPRCKGAATFSPGSNNPKVHKDMHHLQVPDNDLRRKQEGKKRGAAASVTPRSQPYPTLPHLTAPYRATPGLGPSVGCTGRTGACLWRPGTASFCRGGQGPPASVPFGALEGRPAVRAEYASPGPTHSLPDWPLHHDVTIDMYRHDKIGAAAAAVQRQCKGMEKG